MEIRKRLSLQFIFIVALILLLSYLAIYVSFSGSRREDFFDRLSSRARMTAQMLFEIEEIDAELLKRIETNNPMSLPNERIIIYDYENNIIFSSDENRSLNISQDLIDNVRLNNEVRIKQGQYEILGEFYTGQYDRIVVFAAAMDIFGLKKLKRLRIILISVLFSSLVIAFFSGNIFAKKSLKPISDIMTDVNAIESSDLHKRISEGNGKDELSRLAQTFNKMMDRLEDAFKTQKNFIANASHELRTPLTAITLQLEVIQIKARSNEEYRETIDSVLEYLKSLNETTNRLLLLTQSDSEFNESDFIPIRIDDVLWQARKEIIRRDQEYNIHVFFSDRIENEEALTIKGNELLLRTAISNLMDNGCKYAPDHLAEVELDHQNSQVIITVSDKGIGIPDDESQKIFQPFYRARNAKSYKGHGIGLSLVQKIIKLHHGTISVTSSLMNGTTFIISLPVLG